MNLARRVVPGRVPTPPAGRSRRTGRKAGLAGLGLIAVWTLPLAFHAPVLAQPPAGSAYLDAGASKVAVILCHGRGKHPTWKVVDPLRRGIHERLGYHTLSLQMPVSTEKDWRAYAPLFRRAWKEIDAGIAFLRGEKKVERIYLMGHSMGSRMASAYLAAHPGAPIAGFIGVGIRNGGGWPLDSDANLRRVLVPVLDVYGDGGDGRDASHARARADMVSARYRQVRIAGASHTFDGHEEELLLVVVAWLAEMEKPQPSGSANMPPVSFARR